MEALQRFRLSHPAKHQPRLSPLLCLILCCALFPRVFAQSPAPASPYTFHINEDLVQLPTMVLNLQNLSYRNLTTNDFSMSLDGGPRFHPRHSRLEGDDPINLALLLDLSSRDTARLAHQLDATLPAIPSGWLTPRDHISLFNLDCSLIVPLFDQPFSTAALQLALRNNLASPLLAQHPGNNRYCDSGRLWDSIAGAIQRISVLPGRRVVILLTDGVDHHSVNTWHNLELYAGRFGVTLIGLRPFDPTSAALLRAQSNARVVVRIEDAFGILCASSGGIVLPVSPNTLQIQLQRVITLLRERYILEFPRPANSTAGLHAVDIRLPDASASIRPSGITFPVQTVATDPATLPSDPSRAPLLGNRKILAQPE